jgi:multidrug efflux pump subunit AcrA (membrane-fusion protein)
VLIVDGQNRLEEREVRLGLEGASNIEVLSGLNEGDRVLIGSRSQFRAGDRVEPKVIAENKEADY